ncbi:putative SecY/SEC61-alpha family, SecY domain superfamily protein [Helianthus debilis subsp. tardiflorus]
MLTTMLLVSGAMTTTWICDKISDSGFGHGSSLLICVNILTGYVETLHKILSQLTGAGSSVGLWPYIFAVSGVFVIVTMWAVIVTQGCRKSKLQYYGFKLASSTRMLEEDIANILGDILRFIELTTCRLKAETC